MDPRFTICDLRFSRACVRRVGCFVIGLSCALPLTGCDQPQADVPAPTVQRADSGEGQQKVVDGAAANPQSAIRDPPAATTFSPMKIGILPLTDLLGPAESNQVTRLSVFVALLDAFGSQMKAPGVLRFEFYEYVPRSAQPKGPRLAIWPDIDLTRPADNNRCWQDYLRAYEFELDIQAGRDKTYILEVTWMTPDSRRLLSQHILKAGQ